MRIRSKKYKHTTISTKKRLSFMHFLLLILLTGLLSFEFYTLFIQEAHSIIITKDSAPTDYAIPLTKNATKKTNFKQFVEPTTDLAKKAEQTILESNFIGSVLIIADGQIILQKGYGYANFEKKILNKDHSLFKIGSIQKAMTAILVMEQIEAGKLRLEDSLSKFYPEVPESKKITIHQLLTMTSGLQPTDTPKKLMTDDKLVDFAVHHVKKIESNTFQYEPVNYTLLVGILAKVTGKDYYSLFNQQIISHLNLSETFFYKDFLNQTDATTAYKKVETKDYAQVVKDDPVESIRELGTGNVATSNADLYWIFNSFTNGKLVMPDTLQSLWTPSESCNYAGGLYNYEDYYYGHGIAAGFETVLSISKDGKNAVILSTNQYPEDKSYQELGKRLFSQLTS